MPLEFPVMKGDEAAEVDFEIMEPGDICDCIISVKEKQLSIISATKPQGKPDYEFIPVAMVAVDPDSKPRKRHFIMTPPMRLVESTGELIYRGRFLFPNGGLLILFEEINSVASTQG